MKGKIDIEYIVSLVKLQEPSRKDLIIALHNCKNGHWDGPNYYRFVNSINANQVGSKWQHEECIVIEQKIKSDIVIDLLKDGRIGGIEFINGIEK